jgi:transcriptional regulator with XRE-family HTH domain
MPRTDTSRRRMTSVACQESLGDTVARLRRERGLSQVGLAKAAGVRSSSTISRLERGQTDRASYDLVSRLSEALGAPTELWSAAGAMPADAIASLAPQARAYDRDHLIEHTAPAVRRVHLSGLAQDFLDKASGALGRGTRVHTGALMAALTPARKLRQVVGAQPAVRLEDDLIIVVRRPPRPADPTGGPDLTERDSLLGRFLEAHAVAHVLLGNEECRWPHNSQAEADANDLAAHLLIPPLLLRNAFDKAIEDTPAEVCADGWAPESTGVIEQIGRRVGAPSWAVVRRLADDDLFQELSLEATP